MYYFLEICAVFDSKKSQTNQAYELFIKLRTSIKKMSRVERKIKGVDVGGQRIYFKPL